MTNKYSIVVPVYNGSNTIEELYKKIRDTFYSLGLSYEVIFVEDGGQDNSWEVIVKLCKEHNAQVIGVRLSKNFGQHNATLCGFNHSSGDFIITIDDDLQVNPQEISKLIHTQQTTGSELVYGIYQTKQHGSFRNWGSKLVEKIVQLTFKAGGPITSFRLLTRSLCDRIKNHQQGFVYIEGLFFWHTHHIARVMVEHKKREIGRSNYNFFKLLRLMVNLIFNFTTFPLRLIIIIGLTFSIISFILGLYFIYRKILFDVPLGYTSIIVSIYFTASVLLLVLGVIGEYLNRLYSLQNNRPQYSIKELVNK